MRRYALLGLVLAAGLVLPAQLSAQTPDHTGRVIEPVPLGVLVAETECILVLKVDRVVREDQVVVFRVASTLKGKAPPGAIRHESRDPDLLDWATPGRTAVFFKQGGHAAVCVDNFWYYAWDFEEQGKPPVWSCAEWVSGFRNHYIGPADKLREYVAEVLAGRDVLITAAVPEEVASFTGLPSPVRPDWLHGQRGRVWRIRAGPTVTTAVWSEDSPHFVGWGVGGPDALPALVADLRSKDSCSRAVAVGDLGWLGGVARPAVPALRAMLRDPDKFVRVYVVAALARIEPQGKPELSVVTGALEDRNPALRRAAAGVLADIAPRLPAVAPDLVKVLLRDPDREARQVAAFALGECARAAPSPGYSPAEVVAGLAGALEHDRDEEVRFQAVRGLLHFGPQACAAVPALKNALLNCDRSPDPVAALAADLLSRLDPPAVEVLAEALGSGTWAAGDIAFYLGELGEEARPAVRGLQRLVCGEIGDCLRLQAARSLMRIEGRRATPAVLALVRDLARSEDAPRQEVVEILGELGADARPAFPTLVALLGDKHWSLRPAVVETIGKIGPVAGAELASLRRLLHHENEDVVIAAAQALINVGRPGDALPVLIRLLRHPERTRRDEAAQILGAMGPEARDAIPALERALRTETEEGRRPFILALRQIKRSRQQSAADAAWFKAVAVLTEVCRPRRAGRRQVGSYGSWAEGPFQNLWLTEDDEIAGRAAALLDRLAGADDPVPVLSKALKARDLHTRMLAAMALGRIAPNGFEAAAVMIHVLEKRPGLFRYLAEPLAALGPRGKAAVPWLVRALREGDHDVYRAALRALRAIDPQAAASPWRVVGNPASQTYSSNRMEPLWTDLASADTATAYQAYCDLSLAGGHAVSFLNARVRPPAPAVPARVARLVADLDSEQFATRERAMAELEEIGDSAERPLREALAGRPSLELRRRAEQLVERLDPDRSGKRKRVLRVISLLEYLDRDDGRKVLKGWAGGVPGALLTREAKASLTRVQARRSTWEASGHRPSGAAGTYGHRSESAR